MNGVRLRGTTRTWVAVAGVLLAIVALVQITVVDPRVTVRWGDRVDPSDRSALEHKYGLRNARRVDDSPDTWRYELHVVSRENIRALINDPAVADTGYIDREAMTSEGRALRLRVRYPFSDLFSRPSQLLLLHRSLWLIVAAGILLAAARLSSAGHRRNVTIAVLLLVGATAVALPLEPSFVTMGGSADHIRSRKDFEAWFGGRVRFEKHLSQVILLQTYLRFEPTEAAPERAVIAVSRGATAWFVLSALGVGLMESWSPLVLRYLGLALLAPSALLYFGWRELGYLSLNVATFPLLIRGLRSGDLRLELGSAVAGLGAALHGSGLVSLTGVWLATAATAGRLRDRAARVLRVIAWGTAAYLGWVALYVIVLSLPISPDAGLGQFSPWRRWSDEEVRLGRVAAPILSATGARDLSMSGWIVGVPLLVVAASLRRYYPFEVKSALWYLPPSVLFLMFRWPFDGIGGGMDLVAAGFPAIYPLMWVCAHDRKRTRIAAVLLVSAHYAFWRVVLDDRFVP